MCGERDGDGEGDGRVECVVRGMGMVRGMEGLVVGVRGMGDGEGDGRVDCVVRGMGMVRGMEGLTVW